MIRVLRNVYLKISSIIIEQVTLNAIVDPVCRTRFCRFASLALRFSLSNFFVALAFVLPYSSRFYCKNEIFHSCLISIQYNENLIPYKKHQSKIHFPQ